MMPEQLIKKESKEEEEEEKEEEETEPMKKPGKVSHMQL